MSSTSLGAAIESYVPGRIRVRLPVEHRQKSLLSDVSALLGGLDGIKSVRTNELTGSILVEYDADKIDVNELIALGKAANLIGDTDEFALPGTTPSEFPPISVTGRSIIEALRGFDRLVHRLSRGILDAKTLVPLTLLGVSLRNYRRDSQRSAAPWYSLIWYAYSTFMHWNRPNRGP